MELKQFIMEIEVIQKQVPELSRSPPRLQFEHYTPSETEAVYVQEEKNVVYQFNQDQPLSDDFFNQDLGW